MTRKISLTLVTPANTFAQPSSRRVFMPPERNTVFEPAGCDVCTRTGYKGRRALFEVLEVDEDIEGAIVRRENATQIRNISLSKGMKTLREDGWAKVFAGVTSVKEILRVTEDQ